MPLRDKTPEILTNDELKYLRSMCRYLGSLGMKEGSIELPLEGYFSVDDSIRALMNIKHFDNNYRADVPEGLIEIFLKILNYIDEENLVREPDVEDVNYEKIEFILSCRDQSLTVSHYYNYFSQSDGESTDLNSEDYEELPGLISDLKQSHPNAKILTLSYNGSGDSGYIEDSFEEGGEAPANVADWCYNKLESFYGGWEINEGSQGYFQFDLNSGTASLEHTNNLEEEEFYTIYETKFNL